MALHPRTREYISSLSDDALVEYATAEGDTYQADAVEFARSELAGRNLDPERVARAAAAGRARGEAEAAEVTRIAHNSLGRFGKAASFVAGAAVMVIPLLIAWLVLKARREYRKAREIWVYALYGFCLLFAFAICFQLIGWVVRYLSAG